MTKTMTLVQVLRSGRQADPDGVEVRISRQAVEEAATELEQLRGNLSLAEEGLANYALKVERLKDRLETQKGVIANHIEGEREIERLRASFKNFHRLLCERFAYGHDEADWERDQLSLIEWIAARHAHEPLEQRNQAGTGGMPARNTSEGGQSAAEYSRPGCSECADHCTGDDDCDCECHFDENGKRRSQRTGIHTRQLLVRAWLAGYRAGKRS